MFVEKLNCTRGEKEVRSPGTTLWAVNCRLSTFLSVSKCLTPTRTHGWVLTTKTYLSHALWITSHRQVHPDFCHQPQAWNGPRMLCACNNNHSNNRDVAPRHVLPTAAPREAGGWTGRSSFSLSPSLCMCVCGWLRKLLFVYYSVPLGE